ncbi:hypothetical protein EBA20_18085 [Xanthomonas oryzae pv. oryzae]|nr:hypothetical protein EBA20_18085 [Xanthomonas oryzae pv. oryzae]
MPPHSEQIVSRICGALFRGSLTRAVSSKLSLQRTRRLHRETARRRSHTCSGGLAQQAAVRCAGLRLRLTALLIVVASLSCSASSNL